MIDAIEKRLFEMPTAQLVKIIQAALAAMEETDQIGFIAKYIDACTSLKRLGADDPEAFIDEVETFCLNCLNRAYYSGEDDIEEYFSENNDDYSYYNDEWDYGEYYSNAVWAVTFSRLFKLSMMYIQSGDYDTGYEATSRLLSCLKQMTSSDDFLGTNDPMAYISTDWNDLFDLHYKALFRYHEYPDTAIKMAFRCWLDFGSYCNEAFINNVKDAAIAKRIIVEKIKESKEWVCQRESFDLLEQLYNRLGEAFDKVAQASALINCNVYFYRMVVKGLYEKERWQEAIDTACAALALIQPENSKNMGLDDKEKRVIRAAIQSTLTDAYEQQSNYTMAFETAKRMFEEAPSFALYKRARALSEKTGGAPALLASAEELPDKNDQPYAYIHGNLLRDIYSYEGETLKMLKIARSQTIGMNYYDQKYIALSLIYRAVNNVSGIGGSLIEYLSTAAGQDGIADMIHSERDALQRTELLLQGADLLRGIISFHINAAARTRYAKAAYYMSVMRDIYIYLTRENDFKSYFQEVIQQNSRRPALRDEMSIVYGKAAVAVKKK